MLFHVSKNYEYNFLDMMDTNDYLQNNPLNFPKCTARSDRDMNYEKNNGEEVQKIQSLLLQKYFVVDFSYIIFVLYYLYNNGGFLQKKITF